MKVLRLICAPCRNVTAAAAVAAFRPTLCAAAVAAIVKTDKRGVSPWLQVYRHTGNVVTPMPPSLHGLKRFSVAVWILAQTMENHRVIVLVDTDARIHGVVSLSSKSQAQYRESVGRKVALKSSASSTSGSAKLVLVFLDPPVAKWTIIEYALNSV